MDEEYSDWTKQLLNCKDSSASPVKPQIVMGYLNPEDGKTIAEIMKILESLEETTKRLQGHGDGGSHGPIWQMILHTRALLRHFEQPRKFYKINLPDEALNISTEESQDASQPPPLSNPLPVRGSAA